MPDGDVFSKSVARPWVNPSRLALARKDVISAAAESVRALSHELNEAGCEATSEAIQFVAESLNTINDLTSRRALLKKLSKYADNVPQTHFEALLRVAQRALFGVPATFELTVPRGVWEETAIRIGTEFLSELAIMNTATAGVAMRLTRAGKMDTAEFAAQTELFREQLHSDPGVQSLAWQVVRNPASLRERSVTPRVRRIRRSQQELVESAIG